MSASSIARTIADGKPFWRGASRIVRARALSAATPSARNKHGILSIMRRMLDKRISRSLGANEAELTTVESNILSAAV